MQYISTNKKSDAVDFKTALLTGLAPDGGLFMPEVIPKLTPDTINRLPEMTFHEIAFAILAPFIDEEIPEPKLREIIEKAFNFEVPITPLKDKISIVELYHGPTLAFKDFAARFMAQAMAYFVQDDQVINILVATSGDTGGAIAHAYLGLPQIKIKILYPKGKVSPLQEKQLTTMGQNITAYEVNGTFDDCQRLVKEAFMDEKLCQELQLTSANSINIGRLIPQAIYHVYAYSRFMLKNPRAQVCVPCGNFGNLTAGLLAKRMGVPIHGFIAATNINDVVPEYLQTGKFHPRTSVQTISNAMDIGDPSNFARMMHLYDHSLTAIQNDVVGFSLTDEETKQEIKSVFESTGTIVDPHTAVGIGAVKKCRAKTGESTEILVLSTAHPAKFKEVVEPVIGQKIELPEQLKGVINREKKAISIEPVLGSLLTSLNS